MANTENPRRCFICRQRDLLSSDCILIERTTCLTSRKALKNALAYLIRCKKIEMHIPIDGVLCLRCYNLMEDFDVSVCKALQKQRYLMELFEDGFIQKDDDNDNDQPIYSLAECVVNEISFLEDLIKSEKPEDSFSEPPTYENEFIEKKEQLSPSTAKVLSDKLNLEWPYNNVISMKQCTYCNAKFRGNTSLQRHINLVHKKFKCGTCNYAHRNEYYVKLHMNIHQGRSEECCLFCHKKFSSKINTIRHMEAHINENRYQCDKCGLCFAQSTILYNHKLQHEAENHPQVCNICSAVFKTKRTYRHHMNSHRTDRPRYRCEICNKTFSEKYTLKVHKRTIHDQPEPDTQSVVSSPEVGSSSAG